MSKGSKGGKAPAPMTSTAAARIQGAVARANGGEVAKGSFAARAQAAAAKNGGTGGGGSGGKAKGK